MIKDVKVDGEIITLDSEVLYSGMEYPQGEERLVRKAIGLPVTKQLIFYKNKLYTESVTDILTYRIVRMFDISDRWYTIEVNTADGNTARIHSSFLIEMQKPSFVADMKEQAEKTSYEYMFTLDRKGV